MKKYTVLFFVLLIASISRATDDKSNLIRSNLGKKVYPIDAEASAVILFEKTSIRIGADNSLYEKREIVHKVVKILKSDAYELANVHVFYSEGDYRNYVTNIQGTTYTVSGKDTIVTELKKEDILKKSVTKTYTEISFSLPSVKEGSVIEYSYEIVDRYYGSTLNWNVQEQYPKLVSEFCVIYPGKYEFTSISHVKPKQVTVPSEEDGLLSPDSFCFAKTTMISDIRLLWIRKNIVGIKHEPFVHNIHNYLEHLELQVTGNASLQAMRDASRYGLPGHSEHDELNNSWEKVNDELWKQAGLQKTLTQPYNFLDRVLDSISRIDTGELEKAHAIFSYVRSNFKANKNDRVSFKRVDIQDAFRDREGSMSDINFLLIAMLNQAGIRAYPLITSTTARLSSTSAFPVVDRLDYTGCAVLSADSNYYLLDASDKNNPFGLLPIECYNGFAYILGLGRGINLSPELIRDKTTFAVKISDFTDSTANLEVYEKYGKIKSAILRKDWAKDDKKEKQYTRQQEESFPSYITITGRSVENVDDPDGYLVIKYKGKMEFDKRITNLLVASNFVKAFDENPFKATIRKLPVEFSYKEEQAYHLSIALPSNFIPDTTFKPARFEFQEGALVYESQFMYSKDINTIAVNTNFNINTTAYNISDYEALRKYFEQIIDENNRAITLKRSK